MAVYSMANRPPQNPQQRGDPTASNTDSFMSGRNNSTSPRTVPHLSQTQQDLLVAAFSSQATGREGLGAPLPTANTTAASEETKHTMAVVGGSGVFGSPQQGDFDSFDNEYTPELEYLDGDGFDFENADLGGEMIGALPGDASNEQHEKRKNPGDDEEAEGDSKRQETREGEKGAKKPGRKPLTNEPTTKRKAQNRAAQRAFRERKEKHLKDLETKVTDLQKAKEADRHENDLLKAQIERLQVELRDYRKRLSLNGGAGAKRSPTLNPYISTTGGGNAPSKGIISSDFEFNFPKFGALPGSQIFGNQGFIGGTNGNARSRNGSGTPPSTHSPVNGSFSTQPAQSNHQSRQNSLNRSLSPTSISGSNYDNPSQVSSLDPSVAFAPYSTNNNMHGFASTLPTMGNPDPLGDLFSPSILKTAGSETNTTYFSNADQSTNTANATSSNGMSGGESTAGFDRVFKFNSGSSASDSASPSASSGSQWNVNANSSCDTSPEPSHGSPANKLKDDTTQKALQSNQSYNTALQQTFGNAADFSVPTADSFDPVLFGDYRESNDAIVGDGDFTGGFFDDALNPNPFDLASPSNLFGILQSPPQTRASLPATSAATSTSTHTAAPIAAKDVMAQCDQIRAGGDDDYGLPSTTPTTTTATSSSKPATPATKMITCNSIWSQLQSNPDYQGGKFDLDGLCAELRTKARCSDSGVMVDQAHVDAALRRLGKKDENGNVDTGPQSLTFEQASWDNVLKKWGSGGK